MRRPLNLTRKQLDDAFPTIVRYSGFVLTVVLTMLLVFGYPVSPGFVPAAGMIFYKTVRDAASDDG